MVAREVETKRLYEGKSQKLMLPIQLYCYQIHYICTYKLKNTVNNCHRFTKVFVSTHIKYVFSKSFLMVNKRQQSFEFIINAAFLNNV